MNDKKQKAILLLAFGGADSLDDVEPFIRNVLAPREPSPELLSDAKMRYTMIGGSSPLVHITRTQAVELREQLLIDGKEDIEIYVGMRNWNPFIKDTLKEMKDDGVTEAIAVIMAPHQTPVATGGYNKAVEEALEELGGGLTVEFAPTFESNINFNNAVMENMQTALTGFMDIRDKDKLVYIYSAHSLPVPALKDDPYVSLIEGTVDSLNAKFTKFNSKIAYQSKGGGPVEWLGPTVEEAMEEAKKEGMQGVLVIPVGFVSDHVETLYDIDILYRDKARELGLTFGRAPSLNDSAYFIKALKETVEGLLY
jgi:ferrochelatase